MQELLKYKRYLVLVAVLVLIKFVWVPLWETKQENWQKQQKAQTNLSKTQGLLALGTEMAQMESTMVERMQDAESRFSLVNDITTYKLETQSKFEKVLKEHQLEISHSSWTEGLMNGDIQALVLEVRFKGMLKQYLGLLSELNRNKELANVNIDTTFINIRNQTSESLGRVNGVLLLELAVKLPAKEGAQ